MAEECKEDEYIENKDCSSIFPLPVGRCNCNKRLSKPLILLGALGDVEVPEDLHIRGSSSRYFWHEVDSKQTLDSYCL